MGRPRNKPPTRALVLSMALSTGLVAFGVMSIDSMNAAMLSKKLLWPLLRLMLFISVGLAAGQLIEATGWTRFLGALAGPLFRFSNLGNRCSAAFTTAFFSGAAANAMLYDFYQEEKITRSQLYLCNFINQFPAYFLHLPTTFFIVISLTGRAGLLYFALTFIALAIRTVLLLIYGRFRLPCREETPEILQVGQNNKNPGSILDGIRQRLPRRIMRIAVYVVPIYVFIFIVNAMGFFTLTRQWLADTVATTFVPMESLSVVIISFAAEFTSGFAAAGAMLEAGVLTVKQTVLALLIGNIIAFPVRALRHQLPRYIGIFAPKMGTQLLLMGQGLRIGSLVLVGVIYYYLSP